MLQKLENIYLAILRFVVIATAGALLVAVIFFGVNSLKVIQSEPVKQDFTPQIQPQELISELQKKPDSFHDQTDSNAQKNTEDANLIYYQRAANAIDGFVTKYSGGTNVVDKDQVIFITKQRAEELNDPQATAAFAKGFAESIEKTLASPSVIKLTNSASTLEIVNNALNIYTKKFHEQIEGDNMKFSEKQQKYAADKVEGMTNLYVAAGCFGAFLAIVFLSIIIRIERNLRYLGNIPKAAEEL